MSWKRLQNNFKKEIARLTSELESERRFSYVAKVAFDEAKADLEATIEVAR